MTTAPSADERQTAARRSAQPRDPEIVSKAMRRVRSRETSPETRLRKALWARGLRFRLYDTRLPGKPDLVLPRARLVVFVDGDYWHGNQWRRRGHASLEDQFATVNGKEYWVAKIRRNMERDHRTNAALVSAGWRVLRLWESQVTTDVASCVEIVAAAARDGDADSTAGLLGQRTFAEFFAGIGLVRLALENKGWTATLANDIDPKKHEMYAAHFGDDDDGHYLVEDVHRLSGADVPTVSLATASFPCTDLSLAGARLGLAGAQSGSLFGFLRVLQEMGDSKPPLVMLENVPGFLTSHGGADFRSTLLALNELGYAVDAFFVDALSFVPQSRQRLFVIGVHERVEPSSSLPPSGALESPLRPKALWSAILKNADVRWRIQPLPLPPVRKISLTDILEDLPDDATEWWSEKRAEYLLNQMSVRHRLVADHLIQADTISYGTVFRRVRHGKSMAESSVDGVAGCLRTPKGGSGRQILFRAGRGEYAARLLTARECARLMGSPDFTIDAPLNQAFFGLGDAVCVPAIEWIAEHYLNVIVTQTSHGRVLTAAS